MWRIDSSDGRADFYDGAAGRERRTRRELADGRIVHYDPEDETVVVRVERPDPAGYVCDEDYEEEEGEGGGGDHGGGGGDDDRRR